ncbi:MAG: response regulator transcription factor [Pseudomonadota bacterium]
MVTPSNERPYVLILDDHPLVGKGMAQFLSSLKPDLPVRLATHRTEFQALLQAHGCPALLVADVWLADGNSLQELTNWRVRHTDCPWLAISGDDDPAIEERVRAAGAQGFVHKRDACEIFGAAYACVLAGGLWFGKTESAALNPHSPREWEVTPHELGLTPRQGDILILLMRGLPNKRIALMLNITESTVKEHVTSILERMGARTRLELITAFRGRKVVAEAGK